MIKILPLVIVLSLLFNKSFAQTVSTINNDGLNYDDIADEKILNKTFSLDPRPNNLTIKVKSATAFTTVVNDGNKEAIEGHGGKLKTGSAGGKPLTTTPTVEGTYVCGTALDASHSIKVKVQVSSPGYYTIYTNIKDGVMFYASGHFERAANNVDVTLKGIGIPQSPGTKTFQINFGRNSIDVDVNFSGTATTAATATKLSINDITGAFDEGEPSTEKAKGTVDVTTAEYYTIYTEPKNGIFFFKTAKFASAANSVAVEIPSYGIPVKGETTHVKFVGLTPDVEKDVKVTAAPMDFFTYTIPDDVNKIQFKNTEGDGTYTIKIAKAQSGDEDGEDGIDVVDGGISKYEQYIREKYGDDNLILTPYGLLMNPRIDGRKYLYGGPNYVHIFLDELGNSIITSIPQGIPEMQYVVHVIYQGENKGKKITYGIKPTKGSFLGTSRIEDNRGSQGELTGTDDERLLEYPLVIKTSDTDIDFDLYRFENGVQKKKLVYTITMTNTYTAKMSVGLLNTDLKNPKYSIVTDPSNSTLKVAKQEEAKNRGFVTIFATLYASPITNIKYYRDKRKLKKGTKLSDIDNPVADFQRHSKDYLYMRPVWERIYPTIGVGISDKAFENLFFGLNWEFARGASFFAGGHYGKVNVFNAPKDFEFEKTNLTEDQYNLYKNVDWKLGWAFGASVDFAILGNLFK